MGALFLIIACALITVQIPIFLQWTRFCFNNYDLGIYSQALANMTWSNLNPWISVRELKIFNDHFDPIVTLVAPLARLADPTLMGLVIESGFFYASAFVLYQWAVKRGLGSLLAAGLAAIALLNPASLDALTFPSHPTSWAILAWLFLGMSFHRLKETPSSESRWLFFAAVLFLQLFREENAFFTLVLGSLLVLQKNTRKEGVWVALFSAAWLGFALVGREKLLGATSQYGNSILTQLLNDPVLTLITPLISSAPWKSISVISIPFLPFLIRNSKLKALHWQFLLSATPLLMIRLIANRWGQHYGIAILGAIIGALLPALLNLKNDPYLKKRVIASTALLIMTNIGFLGHFTGRTYRNATQHCVQSSERKTEWQKILKIIGGLDVNLPLFAIGDLVPPLIHPTAIGKQVLHHWGAMPSSFEPAEKILIIETSPHARFWPVDRSSLDSLHSEKIFAGQFFEVRRITQ